MRGQESGRHASGRDGAPANDRESAPPGSGDIQFDQWLQHLTDRSPYESAEQADVRLDPLDVNATGNTSGNVVRFPGDAVRDPGRHAYAEPRVYQRDRATGAPELGNFTPNQATGLDLGNSSADRGGFGADLGGFTSDRSTGVDLGSSSADRGGFEADLGTFETADGDPPRRGFLGSGWSEGEPEPRRRLRRLPLLSALGVLVAAGVALAGFRLMGSQTSLTIEPPKQQCASAGACAAAPAADALTPTVPAVGDFPVVADPLPDADPEPSPAPSSTPKAKTTPKAAAPTREPAAKKSGGAAPARKQRPAVVEDEPADNFDDDTVAEDPAPADGPADDEGADQDAVQVASTQVSVAFDVVSQDEAGYSARLAVRNEGDDLSGWTLEIPVGGQVTEVDGAAWEQRGGTLVIRVDEPLLSGEGLTIVFNAVGAPEAPAECVVSGGTCRVSA
jgi:hypothetical protein